MKTARMSLLVPFLLLTGGAAHAEATNDAAQKGEVREVSDFDSVSVGQGIQAKVKVGPKSVRVEGPQELLSRLRFVVKDGTLRTEVDRKGGPFNGNSFNGSKVRVYVSNPHFEEIGASGGSRVEAEVTSENEFGAQASGGATLLVRGVDASKVEVEASGGGTVTLDGRARELEVEASGGAVVKAMDLKGLKELEVEASGGSRVEANPSSSLSVQGSGGSTIQCGSRPPRTQVQASGGTEVLFGNDA
ncbi:DUF2807 domain-containing protein [Myxococcus stipitatus]|uniref:head GIN domain-containing protein n=1 Tax=Myxococcus stipitatus TaxID=83455 RepID=UPI001F2A9AD9|nr:head GIN domain-containing protein [Myxococcus stipitatus]MCE9668481.1 DUF2807 domain-containing protein [Myxococcus stipitatus]